MGDIKWFLKPDLRKVSTFILLILIFGFGFYHSSRLFTTPRSELNLPILFAIMSCVMNLPIIVPLFIFHGLVPNFTFIWVLLLMVLLIYWWLLSCLFVFIHKSGFWNRFNLKVRILGICMLLLLLVLFLLSEYFDVGIILGLGMPVEHLLGSVALWTLTPIYLYLLICLIDLSYRRFKEKPVMGLFILLLLFGSWYAWQQIHCEFIEDQKERYLCQAEVKHDVKVCDNIGDRDYRRYCYARVLRVYPRDAEQMVGQIEEGADFIYTHGHPSKMKIPIRMPKGVTEFSVHNHTINIKLGSKRQWMDVNGTTKLELIPVGELPTAEGSYIIQLESTEDDKIKMEVVATPLQSIL